MTNQGLLGALYQYWDINDKPRLNRRNTFFEDPKCETLLRILFFIGAYSVLFIMVFSMIRGMI